VTNRAVSGGGFVCDVLDIVVRDLEGLATLHRDFEACATLDHMLDHFNLTPPPLAVPPLPPPDLFVTAGKGCPSARASDVSPASPAPASALVLAFSFSLALSRVAKTALPAIGPTQAWRLCGRVGVG